MSSIIYRVLNKLSFANNPYTILVFGGPYTGRTTLLYLLKTGEVVQVMPSIGFNVETVKAPTGDGKSLTFTGWDIGMGCQTLERAITFILPWAKCDAFIWMVDSSDKDALAESVRALTQALGILDSGRESLTKDYPIMVLANKQDLPNIVPLYKIRETFGKALSGRLSCIFGTSLTSPMDKTGLPEAFGWLSYALESAAAGRKTTRVQPTIPKQRDPSRLGEKVESWVTRSETDDDSNQTISQFHSLSLPAWDHYTHIRIAFLLLTTYGRQKGKDMIFEGIERYISESPQARGRTFHVTMTYFWIQVVHLGIRNMLPSNDLKTSDTTLPSSISGMASPDQFTLFLALNPYVADGNLWADYYSKEMMMSPIAKAGMVLPDKKQLPNLVVRDAIVS
ncbi:hypothetical protein H0H93_006159 [Arthromyces matolae]|nr:hypothetical protein H0H93_006159 [Arthromyces matolae]